MPNLRTKVINDTSHTILKQMYREATPSVDFDFLLDMYVGQPPLIWRSQYVLRRERQLGIFHTQCRYSKCTKLEKTAVAGLVKGFVPMEK